MQDWTDRAELLSRPRAGGFHLVKRGIVPATLLGVLLLACGCGEEGAAEAVARARVERMDLDIVVSVEGTLRAAENREVRCEVMGQSTIIFLIPEGTQVKENDVLVKLDSSDLEERLTQQEIAYQNALASKIQAEEEYRIQESQNTSDIANAELNLEFAIMDVRRYTGYEEELPVFQKPGVAPSLSPGGGTDVTEYLETIRAGTAQPPETALTPAAQGAESEDALASLVVLLDRSLNEYEAGEAAQLWRSADSALKLARAELARADGRYQGSQALYEKKFIAKTELEADQISFERAKVNVQEAEESLRLLQQFTHERNLKTYCSAVSEARLELERVRRKARAQLSRAEADRASKQSTYNYQEKLLKRLQDQVEKCTITAPGPGLVVYARPDRHRIMSGQMIEEGVTVRERQLLINLPDLSRLVADVNIPESKISLVKRDLRAEVTFDARRGLSLYGTVDKIAVLPDAQSRWMNPDRKTYSVTVTIDDMKGEDLKPGMSANVKIFVDRRRQALCVPLSAITSLGNRRFALVDTGGAVQQRQVKIGKYNSFHVEILEGLSDGEEVQLRPLVTESEEGAEESAADEVEVEEEPEDPRGRGAVKRSQARKPSAEDMERFRRRMQSKGGRPGDVKGRAGPGGRTGRQGGRSGRFQGGSRQPGGAQ